MNQFISTQPCSFKFMDTALKHLKFITKFLICILFFGVLNCSITHADPQTPNTNPQFANTNSQIESLIRQKIPEATIGIIVQDAKTGATLFERNSDKTFLPASILKIITAAASLTALKPDFQFETRLLIVNEKSKNKTQNGNPLYIQFSGDPSLTTADFKNLIKTTLQKNAKETLAGNTLNGDIILDTTAFQVPPYAPGWTWNSLAWYYAAPIEAIILNENKIAIDIISNKTLGQKAEVRFAKEEILTTEEAPTTKESLTKEPFSIELHSDVITVTEKEAEKECNIRVSMNEKNQINLAGCWPQHEKTDTLKLAIQNPILIAQEIIRNTLKELNVVWKGQFLLGSTPKNAVLLNQHRSEPLKELIKPLLMDSNNVYAESFFKTIGAIRLNKGTFQSGTVALETILSNEFGIDSQQLNIEDGSGTSRYNLISPNQILAILKGIYKNESLKNQFLDALPTSGISGKLKNSLSTPELKGIVHAKTGSMYGVSTLAGFIMRDQKSDLVFVIMINNTIADKSILEPLTEDLVTIISKF